jgi:hypothetical protein
MPSYEHQLKVSLDDGGDPRAIGGAVTVALCGSWEHDGLCRFPHLTTFDQSGAVLDVRVEFTAAEDDEPEVRSGIERAVASGQLDGPGGATTWSVL